MKHVFRKRDRKSVCNIMIVAACFISTSRLICRISNQYGCPHFELASQPVSKILPYPGAICWGLQLASAQVWLRDIRSIANEKLRAFAVVWHELYGLQVKTDPDVLKTLLGGVSYTRMAYCTSRIYAT